ncbi:MAG: lipase maturation factor family protein [Myxococcales bacterium]
MLPPRHRPHDATGIPLWGHRPELHSGPAVALVFQKALALVALIAWGSLASQVKLLAGEGGLLPADERYAALQQAGANFFDEPSLFWLLRGDGALVGGTALGMALSLAALSGLRPRLCLGLSAPLYLGYAHACGPFTAFQWDNMLVEMLLLSAFLPTDRPAPRAHFAFRLLLFKLYLESGIAKWQSHLGDWQDGSAMTFYYETAPIPARLAHFMHNLPDAYHRLESWATLVLELLVPLLIFGPRPARLLAFAVFSAFQVVNTATANYGFFTWLALSLHLFLLRDADVLQLLGAAAARRARLAAQRTARAVSPWRAALAAVLLWAWIGASTVGALVHFSHEPAVRVALGPLQQAHSAFRAANVYHLFGHITRERIEPQVELLVDGAFREADLRYKPGPPTRPPPYVAPHQPRVDFRLWFYGLSFRRGMPRYVDALLTRLCQDPSRVAPLFAAPLPESFDAVRLSFHRYHFTTRQTLQRTGRYWSRKRLGALPARPCP